MGSYLVYHSLGLILCCSVLSSVYALVSPAYSPFPCAALFPVFPAAGRDKGEGEGLGSPLGGFWEPLEEREGPAGSGGWSENVRASQGLGWPGKLRAGAREV